MIIVRPSASPRGILLAVAVALLALGLGGCSAGGGKGLGSAGSQAPQPTDAVLAQTKEALALLNQGQADKARKKLLQALKIRPGDMLAQDLLKQIDTDPKVLLGSESYGYTVKEGETMSTLAQRFLGDPMRSYALARYNGLTSPAAVKTGDVLQIPGRRRLTPPVAKKTAPAPVKKPAVTVAKPAPAKPTPSAGSAARAAKLRGQGLAAMNAGAINRAVALLRQALSFDPGSALIKGDLARALRIQSTLKGRP
jgi:LysM repeat protein